MKLNITKDNASNTILGNNNLRVEFTKFGNVVDVARLARLFQSAEELLEFAEDWNNDGGSCARNYSKWVVELPNLISYVKNGDKDDMVTLRMSRESAEKANFLKFEVKD